MIHLVSQILVNFGFSEWLSIASTRFNVYAASKGLHSGL